MTSISNRQRFGYSIGHFLNDCCASMWFTYLLMFFKKVINLSSSEAAALMLIGQVVDGCFTPIIGILSDKFIAIPFCTQRKSWHLLGTCLTALSFIFIYNIPLFSDTFSNSQNGTTVPCGSAIKLPSTENLGNAIDGKVFAEESCSSGYDFYYYIPFIIVFQIGWASVQISHLALIPFLTTTNKQRADLNSKRYRLVCEKFHVFLVEKCHSGSFQGQRVQSQVIFWKVRDLFTKPPCIVFLLLRTPSCMLLRGSCSNRPPGERRVKPKILLEKRTPRVFWSLLDARLDPVWLWVYREFSKVIEAR